MSTTFGVFLGAFFILIGTMLMWWFPYKESRDEALNKEEKGKISMRIPFSVSSSVIGIGVNQKCRIDVSTGEHYPVISFGPRADERGVFAVGKGNGDGILWAWIQDNEMKISLSIYDEEQNLISYINGNEWVVKKSRTIDCNYDSRRFEVVSVHGTTLNVLMQVVLEEDRVDLSFETYLPDSTRIRMANSTIETTTSIFKGEAPIQIFQYPSSKHPGKLIKN